MHDGLSATNISTCENLCKTVNILFVKLYGLGLTTALRQFESLIGNIPKTWWILWESI